MLLQRECWSLVVLEWGGGCFFLHNSDGGAPRLSRERSRRVTWNTSGGQCTFLYCVFVRDVAVCECDHDAQVHFVEHVDGVHTFVGAWSCSMLARDFRVERPMTDCPRICSKRCQAIHVS
ncbi:hypothetical protein PsorP6_015408 [Peronosclerospora sorghi]|uniref:Uncharacterized protein n=1 Tax=Peronosclerospora sorghi TaxID=230839 RepID=A0ACC0WQ02_9STRA|nr:hypothetical protein PsorP6_015408 [Peronosclerospora sorghi]